MKKLLLFVFPLILFANLPIDQKVLTGRLDNGLTYYIKKNDLPKDCASLKLFIDVGYFDGTEDEVGVAHLLEHLALFQTEDYADYEVVKFLNSIGAPIGPDSNAYTSFYETVYKLDLPLQKEGVLIEALDLISGVAGRAKFTEEMLEKEKGVVLQELRERNTQGWRAFEQFLRWQSDNTLCYDESSRCVAATTVDSIRDFYHRYYRPDRMALSIVGSIEPQEVEQLIREKFSYLINRDLPLEKRRLITPDSTKKELSYVHKDVGTNDYSIEGWLPKIEYRTEGDVKKDLCRSLFLTLVNEHLSYLRGEEGSPILCTNVISESLPKQEYDVFELNCTPSEGRETESLERLTTILQAAVHGELGEESFKREVATKIDYLNYALKNTQRKKNKSYAKYFCKSFEQGCAPYDFAKCLQIKKEILENLTYEEFQEFVQSDFSEFFPTIVYFGMKEVDLKPFTAILAKPWSGEGLEEIEQKELQIAPQVEGEIAIQSFHLSNGMQVVLKKTDFEKDYLMLSGFAKGGQLSLPSKYHEASKVAAGYQFEAGFGSLKKLEFENFLNQKKVGCKLSLGLNQRVFDGVSICGEHEALFQLVHTLFMGPNSSKSAFQKRIELLREVQELESNTPQTQLSQAISSHFYPNQSLLQNVDLAEVTQEDCEYIFTHAFGNPSEFTIIIAGDFDLDQMKIYITNYLATIPLRKLFFSYSQVDKLPQPTGIEKKMFYAGEEETATTFVHIPLPSFKNEEGVPPHFIQRMISDELFETLRHQLGMSYTPVAKIGEPLYPSRSSRRLTLIVTTTPELAERHHSVIEEVFARLRNTPPTEEQIEGIKEEIRHSIKRTLEMNNGWINGIIQSLLDNQSFQDIGDLTYLDDVTAETVHHVIKKILDYQDASFFTWMPASYEGKQEAI